MTFLIYFLLFLPLFFTYFLSFSIFCCNFAAEKNKLVNYKKKSDLEVLKGMQSAPNGQETII